MNWVTVIWSIGGGACLTLALMQLVVWWKDREARASLVFAVMAVAVAALATVELAMMQAETPAQFGMAVRWLHVPAWVIVASLVAFVRLYLRAGRRWLAWTIVGVRTKYQLPGNHCSPSRLVSRRIRVGRKRCAEPLDAGRPV